LSARSDDRGVTPRRKLDNRTADALLSGRDVDGEPQLSALIAEMRAPSVAPAPNAALSAMLERGFTPDVVPILQRRVRRTWALPLQVALGTSACLALVLGAAATGELPDPAQTAVADVVEAVTPLHVPRPDKPPVPSVVPSTTRSAEPSPEPSDDGHRGGAPRPSASPEDHSGLSGGSSGDGSGGGGDDRSGGRAQPTPSADDGDRSGSGSTRSGSTGSGSTGSGSSGSDGSGDSGSSGSSGSSSSGSGSSGDPSKDLSGGHDSSGDSSHGGPSDDSHLTETGSGQ
jgi:hypothetical protein